MVGIDLQQGSARLAADHPALVVQRDNPVLGATDIGTRNVLESLFLQTHPGRQWQCGLDPEVCLGLLSQWRRYQRIEQWNDVFVVDAAAAFVVADLHGQFDRGKGFVAAVKCNQVEQAFIMSGQVGAEVNQLRDPVRPAGGNFADDHAGHAVANQYYRTVDGIDLLQQAGVVGFQRNLGHWQVVVAMARQVGCQYAISRCFQQWGD